MEKPQSLPELKLSSSTAYSSGGLTLAHFVDDLSSESVLPSNFTCTELQTTVCQTAIEGERDRSGFQITLDSEIIAILRTASRKIDLIKRVEVLKAHMKNSSSKYKRENPQEMANVELFLGNHELTYDNLSQKPLLAAELGLWSAFQDHPKHIYQNRAGAKLSDERVWTGGFDATIFAKSVRLLQDNQVSPALVKYRLSGTEEQYSHYYDKTAVYVRARGAFHQLKDIVDSVIANPAEPPELSRIAAQFFGEKPLDEDFEAYNRKATTSGEFNPQVYKITYEPVSPWVKFLHEVYEAARVESEAKGRQIAMFGNQSHKSFGLFIQDVILSNEMKLAMKQRVLVSKADVSLSAGQVKAYEILSQTTKKKPFTKSDFDIITRVRASDDPDKFDVQTQNGNTAAAQLLAEQATALSEVQPEKESKSAKSKKKKKTSTAKSISLPQPSDQANSKDEGKSSEDVASSEQAAVSKQESSAEKVMKSAHFKVDPDVGQKSSQEAGIKNSEMLAGTVPAEPASSSNTTNQRKKGKAKFKAADELALPSARVITLADFEDGLTGTLSPSGEDQGWQTVKKTAKPKPTSVTTVRAPSGRVPGTTYEVQRGINRVAHPVQPVIRQSGSMNKPSVPVVQPEEFTTVTRKSKSLVQNDIVSDTPKPIAKVKETSSKVTVQDSVVDAPKINEEEFPAMPPKNTKANMSKKTLQITPVIPQKLAKASTVMKEKKSTPVSGVVAVPEQSTIEASSNSVLASEAAKSIILGPTEEKSISKGNSAKARASKKKANKRKHKMKEQASPSKLSEEPISTLSSDVKDSANKKADDDDDDDTKSKDAIVPQSIVRPASVRSETSVLPDVLTHTKVYSTLYEDESHLGESYLDGQSSDGPSRLEENHPVTPQCAASTQDVQVKYFTETPPEYEMENPLKQTEDPLGWMTGPFTGPADFQGRPRRKSLPSDSYRGLGMYGESPLSGGRARGLSLRSYASEQNDDESKIQSSPVLEEASDKLTDQSSVNTPNRTIVVSINPDNTFSVALPPFDTHSSDNNHGYSAGSSSGRPSIVPSIPGHSTNVAQGEILCKYCHDKIVPILAKPIVFCSGCGPGSPATYCTVACLLVDAYDHHSSCWNHSGQSRADMPQVSPPGTPFIYETNPVIPESMHRGTPEKFRQRIFMMYAQLSQMPNLAEAWLRKHKEWPVTTAQQPFSDAERKVWQESLVNFDSQKYFGTYHIFSSGTFEPTMRPRPKTDVIYTIYFHMTDGRKRMLSRVIRALMIRDEPQPKPLTIFAWRMIRGILMNPEGYKYWGAWEKVELVVGEFDRQFELEFGYDGRTVRHSPFHFVNEAKAVLPFLLSLERSHPVLGYWDRL